MALYMKSELFTVVKEVKDAYKTLAKKVKKNEIGGLKLAMAKLGGSLVSASYAYAYAACAGVSLIKEGGDVFKSVNFELPELKYTTVSKKWLGITGATFLSAGVIAYLEKTKAILTSSGVLKPLIPVIAHHPALAIFAAVSINAAILIFFLSKIFRSNSVLDNLLMQGVYRALTFPLNAVRVDKKDFQMGFWVTFALTPLYALMGAVLGLISVPFASAAGAGKAGLRLTWISLKALLAYLAYLPKALMQAFRRLFGPIINIVRENNPAKKAKIVEESVSLHEGVMPPIGSLEKALEKLENDPTDFEAVREAAKHKEIMRSLLQKLDAIVKKVASFLLKPLKAIPAVYGAIVGVYKGIKAGFKMEVAKEAAKEAAQALKHKLEGVPVLRLAFE